MESEPTYTEEEAYAYLADLRKAATVLRQLAAERDIPIMADGTGDPAEWLWFVIGAVEDARSELATLRETALLALAVEVGTGWDYKTPDGSAFVRVGPKTTWRVKDESRSALLLAATKHALVGELFNPNQAKVTGLRKLAGVVFAADPETGEVNDDPYTAMLRSWFDGEIDWNAVTVVPIDKAPKFAQKLDPGTRQEKTGVRKLPT